MQHGWHFPSIIYKESAVVLGTCEFSNNRADRLSHGEKSTTQNV